ncbi:MAG: carbohydrate-binding domain-containing protein, partial [Spirochaetia bacterium]|nr:carbohydrate-binding domain-containing protein [Spirochaetia bacterium]
MNQGKPKLVISMLLILIILFTSCTTASNQTIATQESVPADAESTSNFTVDPAPYRASVSSPLQAQTYYDEQDIVDASSFQAVYIDLNQKDAVIEGVSAVWSDEGTLTITNDGGDRMNYVLYGEMEGSVVIANNQAPYMVTLNGVQITGTTLPALQLTSSEKAFLVLADGSMNVLSDTSENKKKGVLTAAGDVIVSGNGSLEASAYKKHVLKIDGTLRILGGNVHL